jgi:iron-sulfur cluster repair protein YtfE (RIC family)
MSDLVKLREDHAILARMFRQLEHVIAEPEAPAQIDLFELRHKLMSTLIAHLKFEDWALYPRLIESGDDEASTSGQAFKDEMSSLAPAFHDYCEKWTATTIPLAWESYCSATRSWLDALIDRLTRENRELLPLLARLDAAA